MKVLGNYKLELGGKERILSFSINMLRAFKELRGESLKKASKKVDDLIDEDVEDFHFENGILICDVVFCALYAYHDEEGIPTDFTRSKVIKWVTELEDQEKMDLIEYMRFHSNEPDSLGKNQAAQIKETPKNL